jgi:hypothetical protein
MSMYGIDKYLIATSLMLWLFYVLIGQKEAEMVTTLCSMPYSTILEAVQEEQKWWE